MFKLDTLTVKNFMSVGNTTQAIDFNRNDLTRARRADCDRVNHNKYGHNHGDDGDNRQRATAFRYFTADFLKRKLRPLYSRSCWCRPDTDLGHFDGIHRY